MFFRNPALLPRTDERSYSLTFVPYWIVENVLNLKTKNEMISKCTVLVQNVYARLNHLLQKKIVNWRNQMFTYFF